MPSHHSKARTALLNDPVLGNIIPQVALPEPKPSYDVYHDLIESIVSQQLSVKAAATIHKRLMDKMPNGYPHPQDILALSLQDMRALGLSTQKTQYIRNVAEFAQQHNLLEHDWDAMTDQEIIQMLTSIKGIGVWTVQMVLMFTLDRPDVFPDGDLGIQHGMCKLFGLEIKSKTLRKDMIQLAEQWSPHRTYASKILWRWK